ncbi:MAG: HAD family phosphatase [Candidatus Omnitrophota bacterium]|jgi:putative hydrolase of the HAD superfamily
MAQDKIKAVIFDLGNVLVNFDHRRAARRIAPFTDKTPEEIYGLFFDSPLTAMFEEGKIAPSSFFLQVKEMLGLRLGYEDFVAAFNDIFFLTEENKGVHRLAESFSSRYQVALLSNINILHWQYLRKSFSVFSPFQKILTSFELGVRKPDAMIYQKAFHALGVKPQEVFYTDDRPELIAGASRLGMRAAVFNGLASLKKALSDNGLTLN